MSSLPYTCLVDAHCARLSYLTGPRHRGIYNVVGVVSHSLIPFSHGSYHFSSPAVELCIDEERERDRELEVQEVHDCFQAVCVDGDVR